MKWLAFIAVLLFATALLPAQHIAPEPLGRYQMTVVTLDGNEKTALLLDTATGRVWKYQGGFQSKDANGRYEFTPPRFIVIPVDGLSH
jgi:hypothetical protein